MRVETRTERRPRSVLVEWAGHLGIVVAAVLLAAWMGDESSPWVRLVVAGVLIVALGLWAHTCRRGQRDTPRAVRG